MERTSEAPQPLRILSLGRVPASYSVFVTDNLDGGGIRGISSLLILEHLMEEIRKTEGLDRVPRPCDRFDFIGGTSTGGIIAIMLGRMGMTVNECILQYREVAQKAFTPKRTTLLPASTKGAFSATALEEAIKTTCKKFCTSLDCVHRRQVGNTPNGTCSHDMEFRDDTCTKTVVLAITKDNVDAPPTLFTTYDKSTGFDGCPIWQVARATSAATTFFKPIRIGRDGVEFVDAGFGYNNPCEVLIDEARRQFPSRPQLQVLSIGTGLGDVVSIGNTRMGIIRALKNMATSSKKVATRLDDQYAASGQYFRFNVAQGLQDVTLSDWEKSSTVSAHTRNYLLETRRQTQQFVRHITTGCSGNNEMPAITEIAGDLIERRRGDIVHLISLPKNKNFVERAEAIEIKRFLFDAMIQEVALAGLGGVGKTQISLHIAYWAKENLPDYSVFWVPAYSQASFEQSYATIAKELNIPPSAEDGDVKTSVQKWLSSENIGPWLMVVDNADDSSILFDSPKHQEGLLKYLPRKRNGLTLFTTRSREVALSVADEAWLELHSMSEKEATNLLGKALHRKDFLADQGLVRRLLQSLTYLPLAVTQAAAYLNRNSHVSVKKYLELLQGTEQRLVSIMSLEFRDSTRYASLENAIARTWMVSFDQIQSTDAAAGRLLYFISRVEPKLIPQSILPCPEAHVDINHAIGTLCSYAFLARGTDAETFDMHSLVHLATRVWVRQKSLETQTKREVIQHINEVFPSDNHENRATWRQYLPHAIKVLSESGEIDGDARSSLSILVGSCLRTDGR
ncbi:phosphorylase superfamily protein, partial [Colletotrichum salicis]